MKKDEFEKEPPSLGVVLGCGFLALILFIIGILTLSMFIGVFFLIVGYYCHKKTGLPWWVYPVGFLFSFFNN